MLNSWQRIEQIVRWSGASSVNAFAKNIGLNRSENLYQIRRGNNGISRELASVITCKYPELSKAWILTGEGDMLIEDSAAHRKYSIPYYNIDTIGLLLSSEQIKPQYNLSLPLFEGCEFAAMYYGDAMAPDICNGSVLLCKPTDAFSVMPGEIYVIISDVFNGVRRVRREPNSLQLRLVASNTEHYDDVMMDADRVKILYHIVGVITKTI